MYPPSKARSGLPQFEAGSGISDIHAELVAGYQLSSRWAVGLDGVVDLHGDAARSSISEASAQTTCLASILFEFK